MSETMVLLTAAEALALSKYEPDGARDQLKPGTYLIDTTVRVQGTIKVGADYDQKVSGSVPWMKLAAVLLGKLNGVSIEAAIKEAQALKDGDELATKEAAEKAIQAIVATTKKPCKGKVTAAIVVSKVAAEAPTRPQLVPQDSPVVQFPGTSGQQAQTA